MNDNNQFVHNQEAFKLYKAKGYTKPYHENEYGWFDLSVEDIKKETIYEKVVMKLQFLSSIYQ